MAVTIAELIGKKDEIRAKKNAVYELETSIGDIVVKLPTSKIVADSWAIKNTMDANCFIIQSCVLEPNLNDKKLLEEFGVFDSIDVVREIFQVGEIPAIASKLCNLAGFGEDITSKIHKDIKN